jgi:hypothetical protein
MRLLAQLVIVLLVCLVAIPILAPATPVLAAEKITLDPDEGRVDDRVDIDGEDFEPSEPPDYYSEVDIYFSSDEADEGDDIDDEVTAYEKVKTSYDVDEDGEFSTYFYVPDELTDGEDDEDVSPGTYYVYVTYRGDDNIEAVADYTVVEVQISLGPSQGPVNSSITITGRNFGERRDITVEYDNREVDIKSGDDETASDGTFYCTILIPESAAGAHTITVTDRSGYTAEATFTVQPEITVNPWTGAVGDTLTVTGSGFARGQSVTITYDGVQKGTGATDTKGSFPAVSFKVPEGIHGNHSVGASDGAGYSATTDFVVESTPPPLPELLSPADGSRVGWIGEVSPTFGWSAVTDPSEPVTYSLQIAATENFTGPGMRETTGITAEPGAEMVTYTLGEGLPYGTYYWSVKAIDSAQNDSGWTTPYSFKAGLLPLWAFIAIIALIIVAIGVLVYFLAIRRKPYY